MKKISTQEELHLGDCIEVLKTINDNCIDLIFADPPYNLQIENTLYRPNQTKVEGLQDVMWDKFSSFESYDEFTLNWLKEVQRVLKPDGTLWVIGSYHNIFRIGTILQNLGFWILNDVIWSKTNPMPNFKGTRFTNAHETMIWASKSKESKYYFNYSSMKIFNNDKQMTSIWDMNICSGSERLKIGDKTAHPTQKPSELLLRVLLSSSKIGDTVLDPFLGTGTTGAMAKLLQRNFIGIERDSGYFSLAQDRIKAVEPINQEHIQFYNPKVNKRTSLAKLILEGFLNVNEIFYDKSLTHEAQLCSDGSIFLKDGSKGSIHTVAEGLNTRRVNGWDFWYIKQDNNLISINEIRKKYFQTIESLKS